jgi:hypothetical protein
MCAEDVKCWLHGMRLEEDPESGMGNKNAGDNWRLFLKLVQAVWDHGDIPPQLLWVIVVWQLSRDRPLRAYVEL